MMPLTLSCWKNTEFFVFFFFVQPLPRDEASKVIIPLARVCCCCCCCCCCWRERQRG
jgi:hypothetical protein